MAWAPPTWVWGQAGLALRPVAPDGGPMPETTDTPKPVTPSLPPELPAPDGTSVLLGLLLVVSWSIAACVFLIGRLGSCGGLQLFYSTGGPPTQGELGATAATIVVALVVGLLVPALGVLHVRRHGRTAEGWVALGLIPIVLTVLTLPPVVHASMVNRPAEYCVDPGYHGG